MKVPQVAPRLLDLTLADGNKFDIPLDAPVILEECLAPKKPAKGEAVRHSTLVYNIGNGNQTEGLSDQYGYIRKKIIDTGGIANGIELSVVEAKGVTHRMYLSQDHIIARRELSDDPDGAKCRITIAANCKPFDMRVTNTRDEIAGEA